MSTGAVLSLEDFVLILAGLSGSPEDEEQAMETPSQASSQSSQPGPVKCRQWGSGLSSVCLVGLAPRWVSRCLLEVTFPTYGGLPCAPRSAERDAYAGLDAHTRNS